MTETEGVTFKCSACGSLFVVDRQLKELMEHHERMHPDLTKVTMVPV